MHRLAHAVCQLPAHCQGPLRVGASCEDTVSFATAASCVSGTAAGAALGWCPCSTASSTCAALTSYQRRVAVEDAVNVRASIIVLVICRMLTIAGAVCAYYSCSYHTNSHRLVAESIFTTT